MLVSSVPSARRDRRFLRSMSCCGSLPRFSLTYRSYAGSPQKSLERLLKMSDRRPSAHSSGRYLMSTWRHRTTSSSRSRMASTILSVSCRKSSTVLQLYSQGSSQVLECLSEYFAWLESTAGRPSVKGRSCAWKNLLFFTIATSPRIQQFIDAGLPEAVVLARKQDKVAVVHQPSNKRSRHLFIIKDIYPS